MEQKKNNFRYSQFIGKPRVLFEPIALADILLAAKVCDIEVSGFSNVEKESVSGEDRYVIVGEPIIFEQDCSIGGTEFDPSSLGKWHHQMAVEGRFDEIKKARLWWHSHVWHDSIFSEKDRGMMIDFGNSEDEWWLAFVVNKRRECSLWLNVYKPIWWPFIEIIDIGLTENINENDFENLMKAREKTMKDIIEEKVRSVA